MFSYFKNGITDVTPNINLDINSLVQIIRNNPNASKIETIRKMKAEGKDYKNLKNTLPNITTGAVVSQRNSNEILFMSGYIYFDIDNVSDVLSMKRELTEKFGSVITMLCISCSGTGLSILVKPSGIILTKENYSIVRQYICENYFQDLNLDCNTKDISRAWFVSSDSDVYYNIDSKIEINSGITTCIYIPSDRLPAMIPKSESSYYVQFKHISEVQQILKFSTEVPVENRIFDVKSVEVCKVVMPKGYQILDGEKTATFVRIIHNLVYLNPGVDPIYIISYLNYINNYRTETKAKQRDWIGLFNRVYNNIIETGNIEPSTTIKYLHFKKNTVSTAQKIQISKSMNGLIRRADSITKITLAKAILEAQEKKVTQQSVFDFLNTYAEEKGYEQISMPTIKRRWNNKESELQDEIKRLNESTAITYIEKGTANNGVSEHQIPDETENEHECQGEEKWEKIGYLKQQIKEKAPEKLFCKWTATDEEKKEEVLKGIKKAFALFE